MVYCGVQHVLGVIAGPGTCPAMTMRKSEIWPPPLDLNLEMNEGDASVRLLEELG